MIRIPLNDVIDEKALVLSYLVEPKVPSLLCEDPGRLGQILVNLGTNAVKLTEKGKIAIRVCLENEDSCLRSSQPGLERQMRCLSNQRRKAPQKAARPRARPVAGGAARKGRMRVLKQA